MQSQHILKSDRIASSALLMLLFSVGVKQPDRYFIMPGMLILGLGLKPKFLGLGILWPWP